MHFFDKINIIILIGGDFTMKKLLVADDEKSIRDIMKKYLENENYEVHPFENGDELLDYFKRYSADMIILDIMMPGTSGYDICREIRKTDDIPIIFVSAKDDELDKILGLELGSDDYLSKPFSPRELVARVKSIFRRIDRIQQLSNHNHLTILKDISIYPEERKITSKDIELSFTKKEYDLFFFLAENKNKVFSREQLLNQIWGFEYIGESRIIDDVVKRIRKKLSNVDSMVKITTVWGFGYKIEDR